MISGMIHETLEWKAFLFSLTGWAKQWYKLHVSSCHGSWVITKDQFCFAFCMLSKSIDLYNEVLNFAQKEGESLGAARSRVIYSKCYVYAAFCARVGYRICWISRYDFWGVFVYCMVQEGKLILDRVLSVTSLDDLQIKAPLISEDEPIITYPNTSDISALPAREELLQLTASRIGLENEGGSKEGGVETT
jgi:hypothetical protein